MPASRPAFLKRCLRRMTSPAPAILLLMLCCLPARSQEFSPPPSTSDAPSAPAESTGDVAKDVEAATTSPDTVEVTPVAHDDEITSRLERILTATGWFRETDVAVNEGVVFLRGRTKTDAFKKWAGDLARNTRDVVAVVNDLAVDRPPIWDSSEVKTQLRAIGRSFVRGLPLFVFAVIVLATAGFVARTLSRVLDRTLAESMPGNLLRKTTARAVGLCFFLFALYLVLQVAGLTRLALTLAGGTGVLGLALGIAFKDITENFLASLYLSIQKPFETADLVEIDGTLGLVQRVTARTTILMTMDGNHVQIPNAIVFKNTLKNFTSNPNRRVDFLIGIGYADPIADAQSIALQILRDHPAVLQDPEPWVLVDGLGPSTVNLRIYFWLDGNEHSLLKVKSAVIRLTKAALQEAGISLPDEGREIVFPRGVPVTLTRDSKHRSRPPLAAEPHPSDEPSDDLPASSASEDNLTSEAGVIEEQARNARLPEAGENLLSQTPLPKQADAPDRKEVVSNSGG